MSDIINENKIYPIIFSRKIKSTIWGGRRLYSGRDPENGRLGSCPKIGEIWSLCENHNIVALNGPYKLFMLEDILKDVPVGFLGGPFQNNHFPLIMKIIDADDRLSIQLHPDDEKARELEKYYCGKTEMWYVLDASADSEIILGFNRKIDENEFRRHIENNSLESVLNHIRVKKGDTFLIRPGCVHAIGKGVLIAEIQQNCDITYRVYDYARKDADGKTRELHIKKALKCVDYDQINVNAPRALRLCDFKGGSVTHLNSNAYFDVAAYEFSGERGFDYKFKLPVFSVFMNIGEDIYVSYGDSGCDYFPKYSSLLMPAGYEGAHFEAADSENGISLLQAFTLPDTPQKSSIIKSSFSIR
ncbi:MAG: putative mannose-6-phosphate isomerase GmuF [bacterium ADurb.Bin243]|nr:MAG: putative mannose-6-phosphate isomerase GmuF [bacterium ADurb.Bin243]HOD40461.1 class I mannose-6-phosphate isomerase [Candidatus Wallbacteria bacterium]